MNKVLDFLAGVRNKRINEIRSNQFDLGFKSVVMLAARVGDMHTCPMVTGTVPHVGGPVMPPGAATVLIGGMPAAKVGDMCTCAGPPDSIVSGSSTVMIAGSPAARQGDMTAHGGSIIIGCPTVIIGG